MDQFIKVFLVFCLFNCVTNAWFISKKDWPVRAVGRVTCDGKPMPYVKIKLMDKDLIFDDTMGSTRARLDGKFTVSGKGRDGLRGKPEPYIRVYYEYSGYYGRMRVVKIFNIVRRGKSGVKKYNRNINFGTLNFASLHCRAYVQFYAAIKDFKLRSKRNLPYSILTIRTNAIIHGGTAYATTNTIRIPSKYKTISTRTAKHELAHTIRHSYDGSFGHFLLDVVRYKYTQHHHCGKQTNNGFAFNEGWAEYWAGDCNGSYGSATNYKKEGNVAKALRKLHTKCNSTYEKMVRVLFVNRGKIHSFYAFNSRYNNLYKCKL